MLLVKKYKNMKKRIIAFGIQTLSLFLFFLYPNVVAAIDTGLDTTATGVYNTSLKLPGFIGLGVQAVLGVAGAVFFAILVYGGILWMISDGEEKKITKARTMIFYAVAGLLIAMGAFAITRFITDQIASKTLTP